MGRGHSGKTKRGGEMTVCESRNPDSPNICYEREKKKRTNDFPVYFATSHGRATTTWQTSSTRIGVCHLHLVPTKKSPHLHEIEYFPFETGKTTQEMKVADFHGDQDQDVGYRYFAGCSQYLAETRAAGWGCGGGGGFSLSDPLCVVHHNTHERSLVLQSLHQNEDHHVIRNLIPLGHGPEH